MAMAALDWKAASGAAMMSSRVEGIIMLAGGASSGVRRDRTAWAAVSPGVRKATARARGSTAAWRV